MLNCPDGRRNNATFPRGDPRNPSVVQRIFNLLHFYRFVKSNFCRKGSVDGLADVDAVLTTWELARMIKRAGILFPKLPDPRDPAFSTGG